MARIDEFLDASSSMATGRCLPPGRWIPLLGPRGEREEELLRATVAHLRSRGYVPWALPAGRWSEGIETFPFGWPRVVGRGPRSSDYSTPTAEAERKLVIIGGTDFQVPFWDRLCDEGVLFNGLVFPSEPFIPVPDEATVLALIGASHMHPHRRDAFAETLWFGEDDGVLAGG